MSMVVDYAALKQQMRGAGYMVSDGDTMAIEDWAYYYPFVASAAYNAGVPLIPGRVMGGLAYNSELPGPVASMVGRGVIVNGVVWPNGRDPNNPDRLLVGIGNRIGHWQLCNGANVQVGFSVRYRRGRNSYPKANAKGELHIPSTSNGSAWMFMFGAATRGGLTLKDYDIKISITLDSSGALEPQVTLDYNAATNAWQLQGMDIFTDSDVSEDGTAVQNGQSYAFDFIKNILLPESMREVEVPYGRYTLTMEASQVGGNDYARVAVPVFVRQSI